MGEIMQNCSDEEMLALDGWEIECYSPFEIRHKDGSFATGQAADIVLQYIVDEFPLVDYSGLALGTRFHYIYDPDTIWVKLSDDDLGSVAKFDPDDNYRVGQLVKPAASSKEDLENLKVILRE